MLLRLYRTRARTQPVQEALAVLGIAIGVALIFAVEIANTSVPASVRSLYHELAGGASLEVASRSPEGFPAALVSRVGEAPGVFGAAGVLDTRVTVIGPRGQAGLTLFGAEPDIGAIGGPLAHRLSLRELEVATPAPISSLAVAKQISGSHIPKIALAEEPAQIIGAQAGQLLVVQTAGHDVVVLCARLLGARLAGAAAESPVAVATLPAAQAITGLTRRVTRIMVKPAQGQAATARAALRQRFGATLNVRSSEAEVGLLEDATRSSNQVASLFAVLSVVVGMLFAYNAMLLTLPERRRYITWLRNLGARRQELMGLLILEVAILGIAGSLVGLLLGDVLSHVLFESVPRYLTSGFPIGTQRIVTVPSLLIAVGGGLLASALAAVAPAIGALRGRAFDHADERERAATGRIAALGPAALAFGCAVIALAAILALAVPGGGLIAIAALAAGLALVLAPVVPWIVARSTSLATHLKSPAAYIATTELQAAPTRASAVTATSALAIYAIVAISGATNDIRRGVNETTRDMFGRSTIVVAPSSFADTTVPVQPFAPAPILAQLRRLKAVSAVDELAGSFLDDRGHRLLLITKPEVSPIPVASSQIIEGSARQLARRLKLGGWAALTSTVAREWHLRLGSTFLLPTPSGDARFRLAATINNYGWPPGALIISQRQYMGLWRSTGATVLRVSLQPGVGVRQGLSAVRGALAGSALVVSTTREAKDQVASAASQGMSQIGQIATLTLVAAILAVIAAMAGSIWQRRPRLGDLSRLGASHVELALSIFYETGLLVMVGSAIGVGFGLLGQPIATHYIRESTGFPEAYAPALLLGVELLVAATALATLTTGLLGYLVARRSVNWRASA